MPLHIYECEEHGEFSELRKIGGDEDLQVCACPECGAQAQKVWRSDTIGAFDAISAKPSELYFNEQLGKVVHQGREIEECQPMIDQQREGGRPIALDWD